MTYAAIFANDDIFCRLKPLYSDIKQHPVPILIAHLNEGASICTNFARPGVERLCYGAANQRCGGNYPMNKGFPEQKFLSEAIGTTNA